LINAVLRGVRVFRQIDRCRFVNVGEIYSDNPCLKIKALDETGQAQIIELRCGDSRLLSEKKENQLEAILDLAIEARSETGFRVGGADRPARLLISIINDAETRPAPAGRIGMVFSQPPLTGLEDVMERTDIVHLGWLSAMNSSTHPELSDWVKFLLPQSELDWDLLREKSNLFRDLIAKVERGYAELILKC
ncbi:hypothetical protein EBR21_07505, partial [bacterium]|nr:hypothetical protein [bacterium]